MSQMNSQPGDHWTPRQNGSPPGPQPTPHGQTGDSSEQPMVGNVEAMTTVTMPGDSVDLEKRIESVGPEGTPADPHSGPGGQLMMLSVMLVAIVLLAVLIGWYFGGWMAALLALALGLFSMLFNPAVLAIFQRAGDRRLVMEDVAHGKSVPKQVVRGSAPPQV